MGDDLEQWVQAHITKTYPGLTREARTALYRQSPVLRAGYQALTEATRRGDPQEITAVARRVYLAWVQALKAAMPQGATRTAQEPRSAAQAPETPPKEIVPPMTEESPFRRYHSADLDADILLCQNEQTALPYWEQPEEVVAYVPRELQVLRQLKARFPDDFVTHLRRVHEVKSLFGGHLEPMPRVEPSLEEG